MFVHQEFTENTNEKSEAVNVLKVRILSAGSLQDQRVEDGPNGAEKGAVGQVFVPDVSSS